MTNKEARDYLQQMADSYVLPRCAKALEIAVQSIDRVEELEAELRDERDRHDRYADYSVERDGMIDQLKKEEERMNTVLRLCFREDPCLHCRWGKQPVPCQGEDYICDECTHEGCVCHACRDFDKWEMEGEK